MPELDTEQDAENMLLAAVMAPDEQNLESRDPNALDPAQDVDETEEGAAEKAAANAAEKPAKAAAANPEEDFVEIPGAAEGDEPVKVPLKDVLSGYQEYERVRAHTNQIYEQAERQVSEQASGQFRQIEQYAQGVAVNIQAALQLLQPPQAPGTNMLDPSSAEYNPDKYHIAFAQYQRAAMQHNQAQGVAAQLLQEARTASAQAAEQRESLELERLRRAWPEFGQPETLNKFVADMGRAYGYSPEELDMSLNDHRNALVARDALAYRAMKAQGKDVKARAEQAAPKLVRSKQEAKGSSASARDAKGQFAAGALANLQKTNSDDAAAAYFTGLIKSGRI